MHIELLAAIAAVIGLLGNLGGLIWGLSRMSLRIENHDEVIKDLTCAIKGLTEFNARIAVLEDRINRG